MLAAGNHTLTFKTESTDDDNFMHCVLVKLTDSSNKVIEEYLKKKDSINKKPTITFQKERGEITFPVIKSASLASNPNEIHLKKFIFSLAGVKETNKDSSASFECISYSNSKLETIGTIEQKLTVQANDEVFQATKEKVDKVVEEEKKNSTREIFHAGSSIHRSSSSNLNPNRSRSQQISSNKPSTNQASNALDNNASKLANKAPLPIDRPIRERIVHLLAIKSYSKPELMLRLSKDIPLTEKEKEQLDYILQSCGNLNQRTNQFDLSNETMLSEVKDDWPYFTSAERQLLKRNLNKVKQQQMLVNSQNTSLNASIPSLNTSNSNLNTSGHSFASKTSSAFVSITKPSASSSLTSSSSSAALSSSSSLTAPAAAVSMNTSNSQSQYDDNNSSSKFKKISPSKQEQFRPISSKKSPMTANSFKRQKSMSISPDLDSQSDAFISTVSLNMSSSQSQQQQQQQQQQPKSKKLNPSSSNNSHKEQLVKKIKEMIDSNSSSHVIKKVESNESDLVNELEKKYKQIFSREQYDQYFEDFSKCYDEYYQLQSYLESIAKHFTVLKQELEQVSGGNKSSLEYVKKSDKIAKEYVEKINDKTYCQNYERHYYLQLKLSRILTLLKQYHESVKSST